MKQEKMYDKKQKIMNRYLAKERHLEAKILLKNLRCQHTVCLWGPLLKQSHERGCFSKHHRHFKHLKKFFHIFIDGALNFVPTKEWKALILGDGDSLQNPQKKDYFHYLFREEKDFSDLEGAYYFLPKTLKKLYCFGLLGERWDQSLHQLKYNELLFKLIPNLETLVHVDQGILLQRSQAEFTFEQEQNFSVISTVSQKITISGKVQYPGTFLMKPQEGVGLGNKAKGKIKISSQKAPFWIFIPVESAWKRFFSRSPF